MPRTSAPLVTTPLGSLTQRGARSGISCQSCGAERVTHLRMTLTDGSDVEFVSCHACEHRSWTAVDGASPTAPLGVDEVLSRTRKTR